MIFPARASWAAAAVASVLCSQADALALPNILARQTNGPLPWVTVDPSGVASTVTPALSTATESTTTKIVTEHGAPAEITGTVATMPYADGTSTVSGTPSPPKPTGDVAGAFPMCNHMEGDGAPFCSPSVGAKFNPGSNYYITWDPKFISSLNTTVTIQALYYNTTTNTPGDEAFRSPKYPASRGFWATFIDPDLLRGNLVTSETLVLNFLTFDTTSNTNVTTKGPIFTVEKATGPPATGGTFNTPQGAALYIGLPVVGAFILLCVVGVCLWNAKRRKIGLGNVMSRSRHGYGAGKSSRARMRMGKSKKFKEHIQLREREIRAGEQAKNGKQGPNGTGGKGGMMGVTIDGSALASPASSTGQFSPGIYRDETPSPPRSTLSPPTPRGRSHQQQLDDEDLGSLVGTPVEDRRMDFGGNSPNVKGQGQKQSGNVFRDEMRRQNGEKP